MPPAAVPPLPVPLPLLLADGLRVVFESDQGDAVAVDGVDFSLREGETLCLVGESGCGKSAAALSLFRLLPDPPARVSARSILFEGEEMARLPERELRRVRGRRVGMVFQEPMTSLNPVLRVGEQIAEPLRLHRGLLRKDALERAVELLSEAGIADASVRVRDFPHQMSGGMRQRVMIAMALACEPRLLIADEPTTALDATVQGQVLRLLRRLVTDKGNALLLITHDLGVVRGNADYVAVMYLGRIVEYAPADVLFTDPLHPYTQGLMRSRPSLDPGGRHKRLPTIPGVVPGLSAQPSGCAFRDRCARTRPCCLEPPLLTQRAPGHFSRCWF
jgi:oligopeptide/dipeptide ABC transporter ATP-binding protein